MSWLKKNKLLLVVISIIILISISLAYIYKPHKKIEDSKALFSGSAENFKNKDHFKTNHLNGKIIELIGNVTSIDNNGFTLNKNIYCTPKNNFIKINTTIKIKGRYIGYDDLLEEFKIDKCIILKNK